ncbi:alkaline phosphatase D family protein [Bacteroidota bacterium]
MNPRFFNLANAALLMVFLCFILSCNQKPVYKYDFNNLNHRTWIDKEFWAIPIEDWQVKGGRMECIGERTNMRMNILTEVLTGQGILNLSVKAGLLEKKDKEGSAGFRIGLQDETDNDIRSLCYFGDGIEAGIHTTGYAFIDREKAEFPSAFDFSSFTMKITTENVDNGFKLKLNVNDDNGNGIEVIKSGIEDIRGLVSIVNSFGNDKNSEEGATFWFDNLTIGGSMVHHHKENSFGPILWSMYTLSKGTMKMTAQMPPIGDNDEQFVQLQIKEGENWSTKGNAKIEKNARIAVFKVTDWDDSKDHQYRLVYKQRFKDGSTEDNYYEGRIRQDPVDNPLVMGGMTCQYHYGFPYRPLTENLVKQDPDILYFSGDQLYEGNGGYGIIRFPAEKAILSYLGKWYMFGWAFGDLMRDRPTICIHDDHEVFQGNLWGNGGKKLSLEAWNMGQDCLSGFVEPADMVHVVMRTNSAHLPDPYDPTPMQQDIPVYYTDLIYGRVSFAIVGDRVFKSGPEIVSFWEGRKDHIKFPLKDPSKLERPDLELLGNRQMEFLEHWVRDWKNADMKVLLSQTIFTNSATHHGGEKTFLYGDMDSGGWPKFQRDEALRLVRKGFAYHICGDQHLPSLIQYGIDDFQDAGWVFCTPAITTGYQRRFHPDRLGWPVMNRPEHDLDNTGYYTDIFGNKNYIFAVGNPEDETSDPNRYKKAQKCSSGYGLIVFDTDNRTITSEAYHFLADLDNPSADNQFPGWPLSVSQFDNYGRKEAGYLPTLNIVGLEDAVIEVTNQSTGSLEYIVRIKGTEFIPKVFYKGVYTVRIGDPESNKWETIEGLKGVTGSNEEILNVKFE